MKHESMRNAMSSGRTRFTTILVAVACGTGIANAQPPSGGGGAQLPPPVFDPALVFSVNVGFPYGLASADILDANGNPGQDGYPEIAVAGMGLNWFDEFRWCDDPPDDGRLIKIYHNKGATVAWDGANPYDALDETQTIFIESVASGMWATELAFGDVTGDGNTDLVLVGMDPDNLNGVYGRLLVFENLGNGEFGTSPIVNIETSIPLRGLVVQDMDLDGDIDAIAAAAKISADWDCTQGSQDVVVKFQNLLFETDEFSLVQLPAADYTGTAPGDIASGDFYADAPGTPLMDFATPNPSASFIIGIANLGSMSIAPYSIDPPGGCVWFYSTLTAARFGADNDWDFAAVDGNDLFADIFTGDGNGGFVSTCGSGPYQLYPTGTPFLYAHGIESGSIDNGPYPDLVVALGIQKKGFEPVPDWYGAVAVLLGKSNGTFQTDSSQKAYIFLADNINNPNQPLATGSINVLVVDLDADGFDDIVVANHLVGSEGDTISVLINSLEVSGSNP